MKKILVSVLLMLTIYGCAMAEIRLVLVYGSNSVYSKLEIEETVAGFTAAHPGVVVEIIEIRRNYIEEVEKLIFTGRSVRSGDEPDVIMLKKSDFEEIEDEKPLFPLDLFIRLDDYYIDDFFQELTFLFCRNGKFFALPVGFYCDSVSEHSVLPENQPDAVAWGISALSVFKEESWELLKYLTQEGQILLMGNEKYVPSKKSMTGLSN